MRPGFEKQVPYVRNVSANPWLPDYPNSPDLRFNYFKLMNDAWVSQTGIGKAPADASRSGDGSAKVWINAAVSKLQRSQDGTIAVYVNEAATPSEKVDYVVVTSPIWSTQLSIEFDGFDTSMLPWQVPAALQQQHLIASAKVFFPLKEAYWALPNQKIPQLIVTDTFVQDAYGIQWNDNDMDAAILASYTWEDDAVKLVAVNDTVLKKHVAEELDRITTSTVGSSITDFIDTNSGVVFQWTVQPTYHGCAKLYRQRAWEQCYDLLTYNQVYSAKSNLYFAGESYGVEGGWTEPTLRTALDAVIHLIHNSGGIFTNDFEFGKYPTYDTIFRPNELYPQNAAAAE